MPQIFTSVIRNIEIWEIKESSNKLLHQWLVANCNAQSSHPMARTLSQVSSPFSIFYQLPQSVCWLSLAHQRLAYQERRIVKFAQAAYVVTSSQAAFADKQSASGRVPRKINRYVERDVERAQVAVVDSYKGRAA